MVHLVKFEVANNGASKTLTLAFERYISLIFAHPVASSPTIGAIETILSTVVNVIVEELSDSYPQLNTDESYTLKITDSTTEEIIQLTAKSVYGVLRGLESLSQLVVFDFDEQRYEIPSTPRHAKICASGNAPGYFQALSANIPHPTEH